MKNGEEDLGDYFCTAPFTHLSIYPHGITTPCYTYFWLHTTGGDLSQQSVEEAWNSPETQAVRSSILNGSFQHCDKVACPFLRRKFGPVQRRDEIADPYLQGIIAGNKTELDRPPQSLGLAYDPSCNLGCKHCHGAPVQLCPEVKPSLNNVHDKVWALVPTVKEVYLATDGEPFTSAFYLRGLQEFRPRESHTPRFQIYTNGTHLNQKTWDSIAAAHEAIGAISVTIGAATEETYRKHTGGDFSSLMENLKFVASLKAAGAKWPLAFVFTVHRGNYHEMPAFRQLAATFGVDRVDYNSVNIGIPDEVYAALAIRGPEHPDYNSLLDTVEIAANTPGPPTNLLDFTEDLLADDPLTWSSRVTFSEFCEKLDLGPVSERQARKVLLELRNRIAQIPMGADTGEAKEQALRAAFQNANSQLDALLNVYQKCRLRSAPISTLLDIELGVTSVAQTALFICFSTMHLLAEALGDLADLLSPLALA